MDSKERTLKGIQSKIVHENGCHLWKGTLVKNITPYFNGKNVQKFLWSMSNTPLREKVECIRMTCGNGQCVNIDHMYVYTIPQYEHGWGKVTERLNKKSHKEGECMIWDGFITESGYGRIQFKGRMVFTHRLSYMAKIREENIPKEINGEVANVMHLCGNSRCVNPSHLELGTVYENAQHKIEHGTHQRGETSKRATISEETAQKILDSKRKKGDHDYESQSQRAKRFGTTPSIVKNIDARQTWGHLTDSRYNTQSVRDKINQRNRINHKLQKGIILTDEQYEKAGMSLEKKRSCEIKNKRQRADGEVVMHKCNNKVCVNPDHLEFGTPKENSVYAVLSGSKSCKLSPEIVKEIRSSSLSCVELSDKFNVSADTIRSARNGKTWTGVN